MHRHAADITRCEPRQRPGDNAEDAEDEELRSESIRVLRAVQVPLQSMLVLQELPPHGPLGALRPVVVTFNFSMHPKAEQNQEKLSRLKLSTKHIRLALHAVTEVLAHSSRLQKARQRSLKSKFWMQLAESKVMATPLRQPRQYLKWAIELSEQFPARVVFAFENMNEGQMTVLCKFFTRRGGEPASHHGLASAVRNFFSRGDHLHHRQRQEEALSDCELGLSFRGCNLSLTCLRMIQSLLDETSVQDPSSSSRHCCRINTLSLGTLSYRSMTPDQVEVVADILSKNYVYRLREINLQGIAQTLALNNYQTSLLNVTRAAFRVTEELHVLGGPPTRPVRDEPLHSSISLAENILTLNQVASICSALRYGCVYEEVSLVNIIRLLDSSGDRTACWRWIAFGLFYPRSKKLAASFHFRTVDLSWAVLEPEGMAAFANTLVNPVASLRRFSETARSSFKDSIILCEVRRGAKIYPAPDTSCRPSMILDSAQTWEALYTQSDTEWLSLVVPGLGLYWVEAHEVETREQEHLAEAKRFGLVMQGLHVSLTQTRDNPDLLAVFMSNLGSRLRSLDFTSPGAHGIPAIFQHCSGLEHLSLADNDLGSIYTRELIRFLCGESGRQLTSLNLNNTRLNDRDIQDLAELLDTPLRLPKLRELRLNNTLITDRGLMSLSDALSENSTITLVELRDSYSLHTQERLSRKHDNEKIAMPFLLLTHKLAFISAITNAASTANADNVTERSIFELIFAFTGRSVRRHILWTKLK